MNAARPRVPLLDLTRQYAGIRDEILSEVGKVLESQRFILGEQGAALERELAGALGAAHAVGVSSGTGCSDPIRAERRTSVPRARFGRRRPGSRSVPVPASGGFAIAGGLCFVAAAIMHTRSDPT